MIKAANALQLFNFIRADLTAFKPKPKSEYSNGFADPSTSAFDPVGTNEPDYPKSLYLLQPLFKSYSLNPVAEEAQGSVPVPDGLDLDSWIVPQAKPAAPARDDAEIKRKKKDKKGKGKDRDARGADGALRNGSAGVHDQPGMTQEERLAEEEERARVSFNLLVRVFTTTNGLAGEGKAVRDAAR